MTLTGRTRPGIDLLSGMEDDAAKPFWLDIDAAGLRPAYDLELYRRGEARTTEERFARSLLEDMDKEADPARRRLLEAALYYGLDALRLGDVAPRYEAAPGARGETTRAAQPEEQR